MRRVCFWGDYFWDEEIDSLLTNALNDICAEENQVEFWFFGCHQQYFATAIQAILALKSIFPHKELHIVAVADPRKYAEDGLNQADFLRSEGYAPIIVDCIRYAPLFNGKCEQDRKRFVQHNNKILRWMYHQCTDVIAYYYTNLPCTRLHFNRTILSANPELIIHHLFFDGTYSQIEALTKELQTQKKYVIDSLNSGKTYRQIADELGVSYVRVQQIATKAETEIRWACQPTVRRKRRKLHANH